MIPCEYKKYRGESLIDGIQKPKARILVIVDAPGWAHDAKTQNIARHLEPEYQVTRRFGNELTRDDLDLADAILIYYWHQFLRLSLPADVLLPYRNKLLCGICSHIEIEGPLRKPGLEAIHRHSSGIFVNNLLLANEFQPLVDIPVYYVPNGVDCNFFQPAPCSTPSQKLRVGWAGSLLNQGRAHRGYDDFILPGVAAVEEAELVTAARESRWRSSVEMLEFYRSLDVYICASRSEGTPNPCLEAAACGIPLVTTRVGNMPELVQDGINGFFVDWSPEDIAAKLRILQKDPSLRSAMSLAARESILAWDWTAQAENYRRMLDDFLQNYSRIPQDAGCPLASPMKRWPDLFISDIAQQLSGRKIAVFGAGKGGLYCLDSIEGIASIVGLVDNDPDKQGKMIHGLQVRPVNDLLQMNQDLIVVASSFWPEIVIQLDQMGFASGKDFLLL